MERPAIASDDRSAQPPLRRLDDRTTRPAGSAWGKRARRVGWVVLAMTVIIGGCAYIQAHRHHLGQRADLDAAGARITARTPSSVPGPIRQVIGEDLFTSHVSLTFFDLNAPFAEKMDWTGHAHVRQIELSGTPVTVGILERIGTVPRLSTLSLRRVPLTADAAEALKTFKTLERLDLTGTPIFRAPAVTSGGQNAPQASNGVAEVLAGLPNLKRLWLADTGVQPADVPILVANPNLNLLDLSDNVLAGVDWSAIEPGPLPEQTFLDRCGLTDSDAVGLARLVKTEGYLSLRGNGFTDGAIELLGELTRLETLDLRGNRLTPAGLDVLRRHLPRCRVLAD